MLTPFDGRATVHHYGETGILRAIQCLFRRDAELAPDGLNIMTMAQHDRFVDHRHGILGIAENIDHIDRRRTLRQRHKHRLAVDFLPMQRRVHRIDRVALIQQKFHHAETRALGLVAGPYQRDGAGSVLDVGELVHALSVTGSG